MKVRSRSLFMKRALRAAVLHVCGCNGVYRFKLKNVGFKCASGFFNFSSSAAVPFDPREIGHFKHEIAFATIKGNEAGAELAVYPRSSAR
jgi:hypothetical protein